MTQTVENPLVSMRHGLLAVLNSLNSKVLCIKLYRWFGVIAFKIAVISGIADMFHSIVLYRRVRERSV